MPILLRSAWADRTEILLPEYDHAAAAGDGPVRVDDAIAAQTWRGSSRWWGERYCVDKPDEVVGLLTGEQSSMTANSVEAGKWYYVVDCATCKEPIPFKEAPSLNDQPFVRLPTMKVRCPHCCNDHTYAGDLISRRQVAASR